jgi:hypothetical protein
MFTNRLHRLLTAYVDDELSARERKTVQELLRRSAEARALWLQLQSDAEAVRQLPPQKLGDDFSLLVLRQIAGRRLQPGRSFVASVNPPLPFWVGVAAAAAVLVVVGLGSYSYFASVQSERNRLADLAKVTPSHEKSPAGSVEKTPAPAGPVAVLPSDKSKPSVAPPSKLVRQSPSPAPTATVAKSRDSERSTGAASPGIDALGFPVPEREVFREPDIKVAHFIKTRELDQESGRQQLLDELRKRNAYRVELECPECAPAMDGIRDAFKAQGINFMVDQDAQDRLKLRFKMTNYALYTENVLPEEMVKILQRLNAGERKPGAERRVGFSKIVVNAMTPEDRQRLSELLGIDASRLETPKSTAPGAYLRKSTTKVDEPVIDLPRKGQGPPLPEPSGVTKSPERMAMVVAYNPVRPQPTSREVKLFLDGRKERRAGTMQVLLILREARKK